MTDDTAFRVVKLSDQILRPLSRRCQGTGSLSQMDTCVLRLFWIFDMAYSSLFDQDTHFAHTDLLHQSSNSLVGLSQSLEPSDLDLGILLDFLMSILTRLLRLAFR
jgi:hypothetical protein